MLTFTFLSNKLIKMYVEDGGRLAHVWIGLTQHNQWIGIEELHFSIQMCIIVSYDCFTDVFAGIPVFSTIGFLADDLGECVQTFADSSGPGLAFRTYPEALGQVRVSPLFSIIFFAMLFGSGSRFTSKRSSSLLAKRLVFIRNISVRFNRCDYHYSHRIISIISQNDVTHLWLFLVQYSFSVVYHSLVQWD